MVNSRAYKFQSGFTLIEMLIVVIVIGVISILLAPTFSSLTMSQRGAYSEKQKVNNQLINTALLNFSRYNSTLGSLPTPITSGTLFNAIYDPAGATAPAIALTTALTQIGINSLEINSDNFSSQRVRVYQLVTGLTQSLPMHFQSGPLINLTYQYGAIYQTACASLDSTCNPTAATTVPGDSVKMTAANYSTWTTTGTDLPAVFVSSLPMQKQMLAASTQRFDNIRDKLTGYLRIQQNQAAATDTTNWYPSESASLGGATPGVNQGCRDGWYNLLTGTIVLPSVGLSSAEYGSTAWGGVIQYCRDYDALGVKVANAAPHYGAIRVNKNLSLGLAPDAVTLANNIVLTF